mgnify:CR=1 FL=1|jgi:hypothetical protein
MSIKLILLKSGEDIIADVFEMSVGEDESSRVVGYFLDKPCIIKMRNPNALTDDPESPIKKTGYEVSLFPWIPLSAEKRIPVPSDWLVTMVEPSAKLKEMYIEDVVNYDEQQSPQTSDQTDSDNEQSDSDQ